LPPLSLRPLEGIPEVRPGDDLAAAISAALGDAPTAGLLLAIAHTVVSKAEGATVDLTSVSPGARAIELSAGQDKDPRIVQVVLDESEELIRAERGVLISRTRHGFVCANAGVDASNAGGSDLAILLPRDPDASARRIRAGLAALGDGPPPAVLITDSFGRAWRHGQVDVAIGIAGLAPLEDWRRRDDARGRTMRATWIAVADEAAAAADLVRTKDGGQPVVVLRGLERHVTAADGPGARELVRGRAEDLFP
jgi:coenzyme F420-0:L-glutamate ligase / coenzyme F420-1:gamma-L-glutamate ligase